MIRVGRGVGAYFKGSVYGLLRKGANGYEHKVSKWHFTSRFAGKIVLN